MKDFSHRTSVRSLRLALAAGAQALALVAACAWPAAAQMALTSPSIAGENIPARFTCDGGDLSPALAWSAPPAGTQSLALIVADPDAPAGTFLHWTLFDLPPQTRRLPEGVAKTAELNKGARQGVNDFGRTGYGGPCPPPGSAHRYFFTVYALDKRLALPAGALHAQIESAIQGHVLAKGVWMGRYARRP